MVYNVFQKQQNVQQAAELQERSFRVSYIKFHGILHLFQLFFIFMCIFHSIFSVFFTFRRTRILGFVNRGAAHHLNRNVQALYFLCRIIIWAILDFCAAPRCSQMFMFEFTGVQRIWVLGRYDENNQLRNYLSFRNFLFDNFAMQTLILQTYWSYTYWI